MNLADTYVNAFVNLGSGKDSLMMVEGEEAAWIYKLKNEGLIAASASIGMIHMWDAEGGSEHINQYLDLKEGYA